MNFSDIRLDDALMEISEAGNFNFSYNSGSVKTDSLITLSMNQVTVKEVLDKLFDQKAEYHVTGSHLIIRLKKKYIAPAKKDHYTISGYVFNHLTEEKIPLASIYEINSYSSAITNDDGYFNLTVSSDRNFLGLAISKQSYTDTVIIIQPKDYNLNIYIKPVLITYKPVPHRLEITDAPPPIENLKIVQRLVKEEQRNQALNIRTFIKMPVQISLVPSISTNLGISGSMENHFSLNVLGGYSKGLKGVELGGMFNILRNNMTGLEIAGLGNFVGGDLKGVQIGGVYNHVMGASDGLQVAGTININHQSLKGIQLAGILNHVHKDVEGLQISGIGNSTWEGVDGFQISGIYNFARKDVNLFQVGGISNYSQNTNGFQVAGIINSSNDVKGFQIAGIANHGKNVSGFQIASTINVARDSVGGFQFSGIANYAHRHSGYQIAGIINVGRNAPKSQVAGLVNVAWKGVKGIQFSGILNYTKTMSGSQIGFINISDTITGVPIGWLSFVNKGYRDLSLSVNEMLLTSLTFRTGINKFYNIFSIGSQFTSTSPVRIAGYGIGTRSNQSQKIRVSLEAIQQVLFEKNENDHGTSHLSSVNLNFHFLHAHRFSFTVGPSFNLLFSDWRDQETDLFLSEAAPYSLFSSTSKKFKTVFWPGINLGIRFQ